MASDVNLSLRKKSICRSSHGHKARAKRGNIVCTMRQRAGHGIRQAGILKTSDPTLHQRLVDEGVPEEIAESVAIELRRCLDLDQGRMEGGSASITISPWAAEVLQRLGDKVTALFLSTRGRVERG
jgi:hypothetical protein